MNETDPKKWPRCACGDYAMPGHVTCGSVECEEREKKQEFVRDLPLYDEMPVDEIFRRTDGMRYRNKGEEAFMTKENQKNSKNQGLSHNPFLDHFKKPKDQKSVISGLPKEDASKVPPGATIATVKEETRKDPIITPPPGSESKPKKNIRMRGVATHPLTPWSFNQDTYLKNLYQEGHSYENIEILLNNKFIKNKRTNKAIRDRISSMRKAGKLNENLRQEAYIKRKVSSEDIISNRALIFMQKLEQNYYDNETNALKGLGRYEVTDSEREQLRALVATHFADKPKTTFSLPELAVLPELEVPPEPSDITIVEHPVLIKKPLPPPPKFIPKPLPDIAFSVVLAQIVTSDRIDAFIELLDRAHKAGFGISVLIDALKEIKTAVKGNNNA